MQPTHSFWVGRTVCVTGGTGFLGYHLVRQLLALGAKVQVLALPPAAGHPIHQDCVRRIDGDVCDLETVRRATVNCLTVFHTAGVVGVGGPALERMHAIHTEGTRNVLLALAPRARLIHTSSLVAIGANRSGEPVSEVSSFDAHLARLPYVSAKRAAEALALEAAATGKDVVVTNPGYLVGPEDHEASVMGRFCVRYWNGRALLAPPGGLNLVDVRDVALGHLLAAEHGQSGRRYILGGENHSYPAFMRLLADVAGFRPRITLRLSIRGLALLAALSACRRRLTGKHTFLTFGHVQLNRVPWFARADRANHELGFTARPLAETLTDTYQWYLQKGKLALRGFPRWWLRPLPSATLAAKRGQKEAA